MFSESKRGFYQGQIIKQMIGLLVVIVIGVGLVLPTVENVTESYLGGGLTATIISYFGSFIAIMLMLVVVSIF